LIRTLFFLLIFKINRLMSKTVPLKKTIPYYLLTGFIASGLMLALNCPSYASGRNNYAGHPVTFADTSSTHSIRVSKSLISKKYKIGLYPDARHQVLFFSAEGGEKRVYQLYLFDMDGKLARQATIRNKETTVLTDISDGNYLFEVFSNDERIENGQLTVN
jgi:hypothetical protein